MDENTKKTTRRVAIGVGIAGVALSPIILRFLQGKFEVNLPPLADIVVGSTLDGTTTVHVHGRAIGPIDLPRMKINSPEDLRKYQEMVSKAVREKTREEFAGYSENERQTLVAEFVEKEIKRREEEIESFDSSSLWEYLSEGIDESQKQELREELAQLNDDEMSQLKDQIKKVMSDGLENWKGGEGQKKFEAQMYEAVFNSPGSLTEEQQFQVDKQVAQQRLERLRNGTFEESLRRSLNKSFQRMVESGQFHRGQVEQAVERGTLAALKKEQEWAAEMATNN